MLGFGIKIVERESTVGERIAACTMYNQGAEFKFKTNCSKRCIVYENTSLL